MHYEPISATPRSYACCASCSRVCISAVTSTSKLMLSGRLQREEGWAPVSAG